MEFLSKYFGKINIDVDGEVGGADVKYADEEINIFLYQVPLYEEKVNLCLKMLDKYIEMDEIAKKAIVDNFFENEIVKYYFECHFDGLEKEKLLEIFGKKTFEEIDSKKVVEKLNYPNLMFSLENNEIIVSVDYMVSEKYSDEILCVKMDENLNVIYFSHES